MVWGVANSHSLSKEPVRVSFVSSRLLHVDANFLFMNVSFQVVQFSSQSVTDTLF